MKFISQIELGKSGGERGEMKHQLFSEWRINACLSGFALMVTVKGAYNDISLERRDEREDFDLGYL